MFRKAHNMYSHRAEKFYFNLYFDYIQKYLKKGARVLDIGCQYGRFTIPLANAGFKVTATDLYERYFRYIKRKLIKKAAVKFLKESIQETIKKQPLSFYDVILCLEVLYILPKYLFIKDLIMGMSRLLKPKGVLITSHRSVGYYLYRFIKEKKFKEAEAISSGKHAKFNCQTPEQLKDLYSKCNLNILQIKPIGIFSGFFSDPFKSVANPIKLKKDQLAELKKFETNSFLHSLFINNARYILVFSRKKR